MERADDLSALQFVYLFTILSPFLTNVWLCPNFRIFICSHYILFQYFSVLNLRQEGGSKALLVASLWIGIAHLLLACLGTFILKRFPTSFAIGFFLGVLLILANQNLIMFGTFHKYSYGNASTNHVFGLMGFTLATLLTVFALLLYHFKKALIVAPIDAKGLGTRRTTTTDDGSYQLEERPSSSVA